MEQQELVERVRILDINDCFEVARVNVTSYLEADRRSPRPEQINYDVDSHISINMNRWKRELEKLPGSKGGDVFLGINADNGKDLAGYIQYGPNRKNPASGEIHSLYVDPASWGQGIGCALFRQAVNNMAAQEYRHLTVKTLRDDPIPNNFYRKMGFDLTAIFKRIEGTRIVEYEMDLTTNTLEL